MNLHILPLQTDLPIGHPCRRTRIFLDGGVELEDVLSFRAALGSELRAAQIELANVKVVQITQAPTDLDRLRYAAEQFENALGRFDGRIDVQLNKIDASTLDGTRYFYQICMESVKSVYP